MNRKKLDGIDMMQPMCVGLKGTLLDCLKTINEGGQGVAFILDREGKVVGLSLIHISEPTRLGMLTYAVFC